MYRSIFCLLFFAPMLGAGSATRPADFAAFRDGGGLVGTASALPAPPMKLRWTYQCGEGESAAVESAAVISGDVVYVADDRGTLHAIDLVTGKNKWKYTSEGGFAVTPLVMDGRVYVGDLAGLFHCVSASDGKKVWTFDSENGIHSSANAVMTAAGPRILFGNDGGQILCLDAAGKKVWAAEAGDRVNAAPSVATIGGEQVALFSGCDMHLRAIKVKDGAQQFDTDLGALAGGSPVVAGDRIYVGTDRGHVLCFSSDGKQVWDFDKVTDEAMVYASPAVAGGMAVVGARDRKIYGLEAATGKPSWTFATRGEVDSSALISDGRVYVGCKDKKLYVLDLKSGKSLWEFSASRGITASPCIAKGVLVIGDTRGAVYCLEGK
jgi:outer membrane protein assembly factor BamB